MIYIDVFLILNFILSIYLIFQHRLLNAIIAEGIISSLSAALFFLLKAPDIAITQVAIGSGFLTFLFIVSVKIKEKIIVSYSEESIFIYTMNGTHYGISVEIIEDFARKEGMDIQYIKIEDENKAINMLSSGNIDIYISSENKDYKTPKIKYSRTEEVILRRNKGNKSIEALGIKSLLANLNDENIQSIVSILPSVIFIRNKIDDFKVEKSEKLRDIYFYLNPYNSDLKDYLEKYVVKNQDQIDKLVKKYV